jgi:hypothetical protein
MVEDALEIRDAAKQACTRIDNFLRHASGFSIGNAMQPLCHDWFRTRC